MFEASRSLGPLGPPGAVAFDKHADLLCVGDQDGVLSILHFPDLRLRARVQAVPLTPSEDPSVWTVGAIETSLAGVFSASAAGLRLHSRGGVALARLAAPTAAQQSAGVARLPAGAASLAWTAEAQRFLAVGGSDGVLASVDTGNDGGTLTVVSTVAPDPARSRAAIQCAARADRYLATGCADGVVNLYDVRLRSAKTLHTFGGVHGGGVRSLCSGPGVVVTQGWSTTSGRADVALQLLDLRMLRPLPPLLFPSQLPQPAFVHALPPLPYAPSTRGLGLSRDGGLLSFDASPPTAHDFLTLPAFPTPYAMLTAAPSGAVAAAITLAGDVLAVGLPTSTPIPPLAVTFPTPPIPTLPPPALVAPSAARHVLRAAPAELRTASELTKTPWVLGGRLGAPVRRLLHRDLVPKGEGGGVRYVENTEKWTPNGLLFDRRTMRKAYRGDCDPRDAEGRQPTAQATAASREARRLRQLVPSAFRHPPPPPGRHYLRNFGVGNPTPFLGFEATGPDVYVTAFLQLLYFVPEVRAACLGLLETSAGYATPGVALELALVLHYLDFGGHTGTNPELRSARATPFLRALRVLPETGALPLLDGSPTALGHSRPRRLELFAGFLLRNLGAGLAASGGADVTSALFRYDVVTTNTFLGQSSEEVRQAATVVLTGLAPVHRGAAVPPDVSFRAQLYLSLCRTNRARAWSAQKKAYLPVLQRRRPANLPALLLLGCAEAVDQYRAKLATEAGAGKGIEGAVAALELARLGGVSAGWEGAKAAPEPVVNGADHAAESEDATETGGGADGTGADPAEAKPSSQASRSLWLPEYVALELAEDALVVWEAQAPPATASPDTGVDGFAESLVWSRHPAALNGAKPVAPGDAARLYRLDAVVSMTMAPEEKTSKAPAVMSMHAKKGFGVGEGLDEHFVAHARVPPSYVHRAQRKGWGASTGGAPVGAVPDPSFRHPGAVAPDMAPGPEGGLGVAPGGGPREWQWIRCNQFACGRASGTEARNFQHWWRQPVLFLFRGIGPESTPLLERLKSDLRDPQPHARAANGPEAAADGEKPVASPATSSEEAPGSVVVASSDTDAVEAAMAMSLASVPAAPVLPASTSLGKLAPYVDVDEPQIQFMAFDPAHNLGRHQPPSLREEAFPGKEATIAIDAEFVATETEKTAVTADGRRVVVAETRPSPARVSVVHGETGATLLDDHVLQAEKVEDFLTRFSGISPADLDPRLSTQCLVPARIVALKLLWLVHRGVKFVGHGLRSDFRTLDLPVPPSQIVDTVELWSLPAQRKVSLRFLASHLLDTAIQDDTHDSVEDAKTANALYRKWREATEEGKVKETLMEIYASGNRLKWTIGSDAIEAPTAHRRGGKI